MSSSTPGRATLTAPGLTTLPLLTAPQPGLNKFISWSIDPMVAVQTTVPVVGQVRLAACSVVPGQVISKISFQCTAVGTAVSGVYAVLYDSAGNLLARSADLTGSLAISPIGAPIARDGAGGVITTYTIPAGVTSIWAGILENTATTGITVQCSNTGIANFGLVNGTDVLRSFATNAGSPYTSTPPTPINMLTPITAANPVVLFALS